VQPT